MSDHPFMEVAASAESAMADGFQIKQKWTCDFCGDRILMDTPNILFTKGQHEACRVNPGGTTDIYARGCNYLAVMVIETKR